jgi:large subunit ribosomal protein L23
MKQIIKRPLVTEKNTYHSAVGVYVFEVDQSASKLDVKNAIEKGFGVKVKTVRTCVCRGRSKQTKFGLTKAPHWKKAFVKLNEGEKIALFEGV